MAFGGLDLEALRAELTAARQERAVLLQQAAELDPHAMRSDMGVTGPQGDGFQGFTSMAPGTGSGGAPPAEGQPRALRKLSWGTPRGHTSLSASTSIFNPLSAAAEALLAADNSPRGPGGAAAWPPAGAWNLPGASSRPGSDPPAASDATAGVAMVPAASHSRRASSANAASPPSSMSYFGVAALAEAAAPPAVGQVPGDEGCCDAAVPAAVDAAAGQGFGLPCNSTPPLPPQPPATAQMQAAVSSPHPHSTTTVSWGSPGGAAAGAAAAAAAGCRPNPSLSPVMGGLAALPGGGGGGVSSTTSGATPRGVGDVASPAVKLSFSPGLGGGIAAAAARAAATAAVIATTGQPSVPWAAHHGGNGAGAGVDLEAHRRAVLKEVLAAVLGEPAGSAKLEHLQLNVETVAAVVRQRTADAAASAAAEVEERMRAGQAERHAKAVRATEEVLKRDVEEYKKNMEEEKRRLFAKIDKLRAQLADAERDRKSLTGKSGQQARELREAKEGLQLSKQLMNTAQATADQKGRALTKAQAELEKARAEAAAAAEAAEAQLAAAMEETETARQEAAALADAARAEVHAEAAAAAQAAAEAHEAALAAVRAKAAAAVAAAQAERQALAAAVEEVVAEAGQLTGNVSTEMAEVQGELAALKTDLASMRGAFRVELRAMRDATYAAIGGFHAACRTAARAHADRAAQLLGLDETLKKLGPGGVAALVAEAEALRGQLAEAKAATERAAAEAAAGSAAYRRAAANAELKARELQILAATHGDVMTELAAVRGKAAAAEAECAEVRKATEGLRTELQEAKDESAQNQAALRAARRELEVAMGALQRSEAAAAAARVEGEQWKGAAVENLAAGRQEAMAVAAALLADVRDRYFQTLPFPAGTAAAGSMAQPAAARASPARLPPGGGGGGGGGGGTAAAPAEAESAASGGAAATSAVARDSSDGVSGGVGGVSDLEAAVGVRLHDVTHERVMAAFDTYLSRQALLAGGAASDAAAAMTEGGGGGDRDASPLRARLSEAATASSVASTSPSPVPAALRLAEGSQLQLQLQHQQQGPVAAVVAAAAAGGWQRPLVSEVVWLEGCLLVALLDLRLNGGRGKRGSSSGGGGGGGAAREGAREGSSSSRPNSSLSATSATSTSAATAQQQQAVRGLVAQLVRTMASERRQLMQRVRHLQAGGGGATGLLPPSHPSPASFLSYANAGRRTLALASPLLTAPGRGGAVGARTLSLTATLSAIPGAVPSHSGLSAELSRYSIGQYGGVGLAEVEFSSAAQRRGAGGRGGGGGGRGGGVNSTSPVRSSARRSTDTDAVVPSGTGSMMFKSDAGGVQLPGTTSLPTAVSPSPASECLLPPLPTNYYHPSQHALSPGHSPGPGQGPMHAAASATAAPLQAPDMDELMDVLQALDGSALRRSRTWNGQTAARRQAAWTCLEAPAQGPDQGGEGATTDPRDTSSMGLRRGVPAIFCTPPRPSGKPPPPPGGFGAGGFAAGSEAGGPPPMGEAAAGVPGRGPGRTVSWSSPGVSSPTGNAAGGGGGGGGGSGGVPARGKGPGGRVLSAESGTPTKISPYLLPPGGSRAGGKERS